MKLEQMWIKLLQAMLDSFGPIPDSADNMPDWIIERVKEVITERDELRTQLNILRADLGLITIERNLLRSELDALRKPPAQSLHDKALVLAQIIRYGHTVEHLAAKIEALFKD